MGTGSGELKLIFAEPPSLLLLSPECKENFQLQPNFPVRD